MIIILMAWFSTEFHADYDELVPFYTGSVLYFPFYIFSPGLYLVPVYMWISVTHSNRCDLRRIKEQETRRKKEDRSCNNC